MDTKKKAERIVEALKTLGLFETEVFVPPKEFGEPILLKGEIRGHDIEFLVMKSTQKSHIIEAIERVLNV